MNLPGNGSLYLSGANTFTDTISLTTGYLLVANNQALGTSTNAVSLGNGVLGIAVTGLTIPNPITITDVGYTAYGVAETGAIRLMDTNPAGSGMSGTLSGTITLTGGTWYGSVQSNNPTGMAAVGVDGKSDILYLTGQLGGAGSLGKTGPGTLQLSGTVANNFSGNTYVFGGTLQLNNSSGQAIPNGTVYIGDWAGGSDSDVLQILNGANQQMSSTKAMYIESSGLLDLSHMTGSNAVTLSQLYLYNSMGAAADVNLGSNDLVPSPISLRFMANSRGRELPRRQRQQLPAATIQGSSGSLDFSGASATITVNSSLGGRAPRRTCRLPSPSLLSKRPRRGDRQLQQ